jgi:hypothetical protein
VISRFGTRTYCKKRQGGVGKDVGDGTEGGVQKTSDIGGKTAQRISRSKDQRGGYAGVNTMGMDGTSRPSVSISRRFRPACYDAHDGSRGGIPRCIYGWVKMVRPIDEAVSLPDYCTQQGGGKEEVSEVMAHFERE